MPSFTFTCEIPERYYFRSLTILSDKKLLVTIGEERREGDDTDYTGVGMHHLPNEAVRLAIAHIEKKRKGEFFNGITKSKKALEIF